MAVDGTHTKVPHSMIVLGITTLDGNGETLLLGWALIPSESKENWMCFLKGMRRFFPGLTEDEAVIISDRAKGLKSALNANFYLSRYFTVSYNTHITWLEDLQTWVFAKGLLFRDALGPPPFN